MRLNDTYCPSEGVTWYSRTRDRISQFYLPVHVDFKMLKCRRFENALLGTVDFQLDDGTVVFRTCDAERDKVVFQVGTCDAYKVLEERKRRHQSLCRRAI